MRRIWIPITLLVIATLAAADQPVPIVKPLEVHPGLPPFEVRIVPISTQEKAGPPHPIGRVEISRRGESRPFQTLEVSGYNGPRNLPFSRFEDANFDGYTDLLLGNDGGAKWGGYELFFYDPVSQSFVQGDLGREMSARLRGNELEFDRARREIRVSLLVAGCQENVPVTEAFVIKGGHLRQTRQEDLVHGEGEEGCYRVIRKVLADGSLQEVSRQRAPEYDGAE